MLRIWAIVMEKHIKSMSKSQKHNFPQFMNLITIQIKTFFHVGIEYKKNAAYCVRLDRVPGLAVGAQDEIRHYISGHKDKGTNSIPRRFLSIGVSKPGQVCKTVTY